MPTFVVALLRPDRGGDHGNARAPVLAGMVSTTLFVGSYLPMLVKAFRTRDLDSYSLGNLVLANVGNAVHSVYVFSLPVGPIWFLHTFYLLATRDARVAPAVRRSGRRGAEPARRAPDHG